MSVSLAPPPTETERAIAVAWKEFPTISWLGTPLNQPAGSVSEQDSETRGQARMEAPWRRHARQLAREENKP